MRPIMPHCVIPAPSTLIATPKFSHGALMGNMREAMTTFRPALTCAFACIGADESGLKALQTSHDQGYHMHPAILASALQITHAVQGPFTPSPCAKTCSFAEYFSIEGDGRAPAVSCTLSAAVQHSVDGSRLEPSIIDVTSSPFDYSSTRRGITLQGMQMQSSSQLQPTVDSAGDTAALSSSESMMYEVVWVADAFISGSNHLRTLGSTLNHTITARNSDGGSQIVRLCMCEDPAIISLRALRVFQQLTSDQRNTEVRTIQLLPSFTSIIHAQSFHEIIKTSKLSPQLSPPFRTSERKGLHFQRDLC